MARAISSFGGVGRCHALDLRKRDLQGGALPYDLLEAALANIGVNRS